MVKQSLFPMGAFFSSERFGKPQILAGILLLIFAGQCAWLVSHETPAAISQDEFERLAEGLAQWHGRGIAGTPVAPSLSAGLVEETGSRFDPNHSALWYLVASAPVAVFNVPPEHRFWPWLTRAPYVVFGTLLGASLWYVSRRLYGNAGGFIALGLYCFSPTVIRNSTLWFSPPNIGASWGTFGAVFTAIAVSHTLYAPREVVLWNWRRTILLGVSLALAIGSHFALIIVLPVLLVFMFYLAPNRKLAAATILGAAFLIAVLLLFTSYFFHVRIFAEAFRHAQFVGGSWFALGMPGAYLQVVKEIAASGPVLIVLVPIALGVFVSWRRARYFGNIAPLIMAILFLVLRLLSPHDSGSIFMLCATTFLFVFVAGIAADLLETRAREPVLAAIAGLLVANALWNLIVLARVSA